MSETGQNSKRSFFGRDVVAGVAHLHELGIVHRDLKPQNVLIINEKSFCSKLSDMGISKRLLGDMSSLTQHPTGKDVNLCGDWTI